MSTAAQRVRAGRKSTADTGVAQHGPDHNDDADSSGRPKRVASQNASQRWASMIPKSRTSSRPMSNPSLKSASNSSDHRPPQAPVVTRKSEKEKRKRAESIVEGGGQSVVGQHVGDGASERQKPKKARVGGALKSSSKSTRPYAPPAIDEDSESGKDVRIAKGPSKSSGTTARTKIKSSSRKPTHSATSADAEDMLGDSGEDGQDAQSEQDSEEAPESREQCDDFDMERVMFICSESAQLEAGHNDAPPRLRTKSTGSRSSSPMSVLPSEPPTTDSDGFTVNRTAYDSDEALDRVPQAPKLGLQHRGSSKQSQPRAPSRRYAVMESSDNEDVEEAQNKVPTKTSRQLTKNQWKKYEQEMPEIRPSTAASEGPVDGASDIEWLPRTEIEVIRGRRSINMKMTEQNPVMQQVLHCAFKSGDRIIAFGAKDEPVLDMDSAAIRALVTPFEKDSLDGIALKALLEAAELGGYDGDGDVAERLELGSTRDYIKPLVSHRLGLFRSAIKKAVTPIIEHTFRLGLGNEPTDGVPDKAALLKERSYIYPWDAMGVLNQSAPYESPIIKPSLRASFFVTAQYIKVGLQNGKSFLSSYAAAPSESEIPPTMLALCMTAVESIISDHHMKLAKASDFNATSAAVYQDHLVRLVELRRQRPKRYHRIMHDLFTAVTSGHNLEGAAQGASNGAGVDWSHIPDE
ncbi:hypothetical protein C8Q72DRAFT_892106 [Fomitopsis betulina]|nr:hypothetical protein C8Q72DRAFT_892106 [Fomitopsis betulina]